ncbi:MAG TPA: hypothetical protein VF771_08860 [Longimicrobiaceae bacterium]
MKRVRPFALALLAVAACSEHQYTVRDYWGLLPDVVRFADADARQNAGPKPPEGPLWIDVNSFAGGGWQLTEQKLSRDSVMSHVAIPNAQRIDKPQEVIMLEDTGTVAATPEAMAGFTGGRWIRGYGVMLHLNLVKADNREIAVTVTSYYTDRRTWPTGICRRVQRVTYRPDANGGWKRMKNELRKGCDDPD